MLSSEASGYGFDFNINALKQGVKLELEMVIDDIS